MDALRKRLSTMERKKLIIIGLAILISIIFLVILFIVFGKCKNLIGESLTEEEKSEIVDLHNFLRRKVASGQENRGNPGPQPAAKVMGMLNWDVAIATKAQKYASKCKGSHDSDRDDTAGRFSLGENLAMMSTSGDIENIKISELIMMWYNEVDLHPGSNVERFRFASGYGHYTQMIWSKSIHIGCGVTKRDDGKMRRVDLVCKYGPAGNVLGQPIYET